MNICDALVQHLKNVAANDDPSGYYAGRILCDVLPVTSQVIGLDGNAASNQLKEAKTHRSRSCKSGNPRLIVGFLISALVSGYSELLNGSKELDLILNGLVSSISGVSASAGVAALTEDGLPKLTTLNVLCEIDESFWARIKEFRQIVLLRTTLYWVDVVRDSPFHWVVSTEVLRLVKSLLPWTKHAEADFWEKTYKLLNDSLEVESSFFAPWLMS